MQNLEDEITTDTSLQEKLKNLGKQFSKWAIISSLVIFVVLVVLTVVETIYGDDEVINGKKNEDKKNAADIIFSKIPKHLNLAVVLIIVSVPEALPLAV